MFQIFLKINKIKENFLEWIQNFGHPIKLRLQNWPPCQCNETKRQRGKCITVYFDWDLFGFTRWIFIMVRQLLKVLKTNLLYFFKIHVKPSKSRCMVLVDTGSFFDIYYHFFDIDCNGFWNVIEWRAEKGSSCHFSGFAPMTLGFQSLWPGFTWGHYLFLQVANIFSKSLKRCSWYKWTAHKCSRKRKYSFLVIEFWLISLEFSWSFSHLLICDNKTKFYQLQELIGKNIILITLIINLSGLKNII